MRPKVTKAEKKRKADCKKLKELIREKPGLPKHTAISSEFNKRYGNFESKEITEGRLRRAVAYSCGEIHSNSADRYIVGQIPNYNGLNGTCITALCKLQRDHNVFPNPYVYIINEKVVMIEVRQKYADRAKYLLNKAFTKRYIYKILLSSNQLIIMLLSGAESDKCNMDKDGVKCRLNQFSQIEFGSKSYKNPLIKGLTADQPLSYAHLHKMLRAIVESHIRVMKVK